MTDNLLEEIREMAGEWTVSVSDPGFLNWLNARLGRTEAERDAAIDRAEAAEAELAALREQLAAHLGQPYPPPDGGTHGEE